MYIYLGILLLLSAAAFYPVARGYLRKQQELAGVAAPAGRRKQAGRGRRKPYSERTARAPVNKRKAADPKPARKSFRAASVQPGPECCKAAVAMQEKRFLLDKLPRLPLDGCDRLGDCKCSFTQHADRRSGFDRRARNKAFARTGADGNRSVNRRAGMERRSGFSEDISNITFE